MEAKKRKLDADETGPLVTDDEVGNKDSAEPLTDNGVKPDAADNAGSDNAGSDNANSCAADDDVKEEKPSTPTKEDNGTLSSPETDVDKDGNDNSGDGQEKKRGFVSL